MQSLSVVVATVLAADMGIPGFKGGKSAKKKSAGGSQPLGLPDPGQLTPTTLPLADLEAKEQKARGDLNDAKTKVHDLPGKIRDTRKRIKDIRGRNAQTKETKAKKARDLDDALKDLRAQQRSLNANRKAEPERRKAWKKLEADLKQARKYQAAITKTETLADTYAQEMRAANLRGDRSGWDAAKGRRGGALKVLRDLLGNAQKLLKNKNSQAAAELAGALASAEVSDLELGNESYESSDDAYSPDEKRRLSELDRDVALAALTQGTEDDTTAATAKEQFLTGLLGAAQGAGRSADVIRELAEAVGSARSNVASLTGKGTNDNPDLQAQLDQANEKARIADLNSRQNAALWSAWNGPGDIGMGGGPTVNVSMNMLTGADPRVALNAANAVVAGIGYQGGIASPRTQVA